VIRLGVRMALMRGGFDVVAEAADREGAVSAVLRLPAALCGVLKGEAALPRTLVGLVLNEFRDYTAAVADPVRVGEVELTARESEILRMLGSGLSTVEVGEMLSLSPITVRRHISAGVAKLGVADREAAIRAIEPVVTAA
jgi:DNA-binding NarL/FixJ family response regulator